MHTGIWCCEFLILARLGVLEVIGTAEIVLGSCAADGGIFFVAIHIEFDFPLTPPAVVIDAPCEICAHILPFAFYSVDKGV